LTTLAGIYRDSPGWLRLSCRYDPLMQADLKDALGRGNYSWSPVTRLWYVREQFLDVARVILKGHGYEVKTDREQPTFRKSPWEEILGSMPRDRAESLYKKASSILHPDVGGDLEQMKDLNQAWQKITES